ncbi:MMPL family transporter [Calditerricola satsumensis]
MNGGTGVTRGVDVWQALARLTCRWPKAIVLAWLAALVWSVPYAAQLPERLKGTGFVDASSPSHYVAEQLRERLGHPASALFVFLEARGDGAAAEARLLRAAEGLRAKIAALPAVREVALMPPPREGAERGVAVLTVRLDVDDERAQDLVPALRALAKESGVPGYVTGTAAVDRDIAALSQADLARAELVGVPLALLVLLVAFGSVGAAFLPVAVGLASVTAALALLGLVAQRVDLSVFTLNVVTMLGLAVGIDYALLVTSRFREERRRGFSVPNAVRRTLPATGRTLVTSGLLVAAGLACAYGFDVMVFSSIATGGIVVVALSVLAGITLLPALLVWMGDRVDRWRLVPPFGGGERVIGFVTRLVLRRPILVLLLVMACLWPAVERAGAFRVGVLDSDALPDAAESKYALGRMESVFGVSRLYPIDILVETDRPVQDRRTLQKLDSLLRAIERQPHVVGVESVVRVVPTWTVADYARIWRDPERLPEPWQQLWRQHVGDRVTAVRVLTDLDPKSDAAGDLVRRLRALDPPEGLAVWVGGKTAAEHDFLQKIRARAPAVAAAVLTLTFVLLMAAFSPVLALKGLLLNALSVAATFGLLVAVFQEGWGAEWLGAQPHPFLDASIPVFILCVAFGLSMDYEVFLLARIREAYRHTGNLQRAIVEGLTKSGRIITSAALIIIAITGSFALAGIQPVKQIGFGIAAAVAIDATLIRLLLVPALMKLMGRWNWWPHPA